MVDGEGRMSDTDVEDFNLEPSIKVVPSSVASGDTVNVFAQDYSNDAGRLRRAEDCRREVHDRAPATTGSL